MKLPFSVGNHLYHKSFWLYKPLYYHYKRNSDRAKIALLQDYLKPNMNVVDIGANIGFYTELFSNAVGPGGRVIAFEPDRINFSHLQKLAQNNIVLENKAIGNTNQLIKLYLSEDLNVDHRTYDDGSGRKYNEVESVRLDDYLDDNQKIDLIKIDVQGYDFFAVQGMQKTIRFSENIMLITEFWPYGLKKAGIKSNDFLNLIKDCGLKYYLLDNDVLQPENFDQEYYCDLICSK